MMFYLVSRRGHHAFQSKRATRLVSVGLFETVNEGDRKRIVFLGTPEVAAESLRILHTATTNDYSGLCKLVGVVTQPPAPAGRKKKLTPSPVQVLSEELSLPLMIPETAKDPEFLDTLRNMKVDLCITAAYGNFLPKAFLSIPRFGTINIHPSLLPNYRGAAPVQRCLENGDKISGVTVAFTVLKMDAGPIISQIEFPLSDEIKAPELLSHSFKVGTEELIRLLPKVFDGSVNTVQQNDELATPAAKLSTDEAWVDLIDCSARKVHNKCRAFAEWPGLTGLFLVGANATEPQRIKIITTTVLTEGDGTPTDVSITVAKFGKNDILQITCADSSKLGVLELQPAGKKIMDAKAFINGLRGDRCIKWVPNRGQKLNLIN